MAVTVQVCDLLHVPLTAPPTAVSDAIPQLSVTGPAAAIACVWVIGAGLQPSGIVAVGHTVNTGLCVSDVQV